jgi:hypothetical protein
VGRRYASHAQYGIVAGALLEFGRARLRLPNFHTLARSFPEHTDTVNVVLIFGT